MTMTRTRSIRDGGNPSNSNSNGSALPLAAVARRADQLLSEQLLAIWKRTDHLFAGLMVIQWLAGIVAAVFISPKTYDGLNSHTHPHVYAAVFLGGAIASLPIILALTRPGKALTRHTIAVGQMLFSALLIHLTGGRIETHFHVFGSLAFLAVYRDWTVLVSASIVVGIDHFFRGVFYPVSVYGIASPSSLRWLEHVGWVAFEDIFLWITGRQSLAEMKATAERQAMLEDSTQAAEAANQAKRIFLANMSHEVRTPLTSILGYADLLASEGQSKEDHDEYIQTIRRNGEHLLGVLNDVLDISRIEAGRFKLEKAACSPAQIVLEVLAFMRPRALEKELHLQANFQTRLPKAIYTDPTRLRQILTNLVSNAVKFTDAGAVTVDVAMTASPGADGGTILFHVIDTGIGLDAEQQARLFEAFSQVHSESNRRFGGAGLGLAISRRLAEMLGGSLTVQSNAGQGSTFTLNLPIGSLIDIETVFPPPESLRTANAQVAEEATEVRRCTGRILLADDSVDNQRLLKRLLERRGLHVETVGDGRAAVQRALATTAGVDLILLDMQMPEMDGYSAAAALRVHGYKGKIMAITAHASDQDRQRCLSAGCDDYVSKPFDLAHLFGRIEHHVQSSRQQSTLAAVEAAESV